METVDRAYLEEHVLDRHTRGWYALCPECGGDRFYYTEDNGLAYCWHCGYKATTAAKEVVSSGWSTWNVDIGSIRHVYSDAAEVYARQLGKSQLSYLMKKRGLTKETVERFRLGFCPNITLDLYKNPSVVDAGLATRSRSPTLANRISIPYLNEEEVVDMRGRATQTGQNPKYMSLPGSSESRGSYYMFNWERASRLADKLNVLIITEGEFKAVVADQFGFACAALPGMTTWKSGTAFSPSWKVIIAFDSERSAESQTRVDRAIVKAASHIPHAYVIKLPLFEEDTKQDIDSFLIHPLGGPDRFHYLLENALPFEEYKALRAF